MRIALLPLFIVPFSSWKQFSLSLVRIILSAGSILGFYLLNSMFLNSSPSPFFSPSQESKNPSVPCK